MYLYSQFKKRAIPRHAALVSSTFGVRNKRDLYQFNVHERKQNVWLYPWKQTVGSIVGTLLFLSRHFFFESGAALADWRELTQEGMHLHGNTNLDHLVPDSVSLD